MLGVGGPGRPGWASGGVGGGGGGGGGGGPRGVAAHVATPKTDHCTIHLVGCQGLTRFMDGQPSEIHLMTSEISSAVTSVSSVLPRGRTQTCEGG